MFANVREAISHMTKQQFMGKKETSPTDGAVKYYGFFFRTATLERAS